MRRRYYAGGDLRRTLDVEELRQFARRRLPHFVYEYLEGGSEDERTLRRNLDAFDDWLFVHRVLVDVSHRSLATTILGQPSTLPLVIAPTASNGMFWKHGDIALAKAARRQGIPFITSIVANDPLEDIVAHAGGRVWMMILVMRDHEIVERLIARADAAGCEALVITLDMPVLGHRAWERRSRNFTGSVGLSARAKLDMVAHLRWMLGVYLPDGLPGFGNLTNGALDRKEAVTGQSDTSLSWDSIRRLRDRWPRKLVLKGVMAASDAELAAEVGVDAVLVSNHGGRQLDAEAAPLDVLGDIVRAVGSKLEVIVDGGFRRGTDIVKALALGARAVALGRAPLYGLAAGGEDGVMHALDLLRVEMDRTLALLGVPDVLAIGPHVLQRVSQPRVAR